MDVLIKSIVNKNKKKVVFPSLNQTLVYAKSGFVRRFFSGKIMQ